MKRKQGAKIMDNEMPIVICLFEASGLSAAPWAKAGYKVYCYDKCHTKSRVVSCGKGQLVFEPWDAADGLGGKSERTKTIRSLSPRGIARAIFEANR